MTAYQTKDFKKWNKKNKIPPEKLLKAIESIDSGSGVVDYGEGLYKVRVAKDKGKSGGYRTIIIHKNGLRSLIVYGYEKKEKENISDVEKKYFKKDAIDFLSYSEDIIKNMLENGDIFKLEKKQ